MRILIQRVRSGAVEINGQTAGSIGQGMVALVGVGKGDTAADADYLARKTAALRIFEDDNGKLNRSLRDTGGAALVVSQFTLYADTRRGNRPGFDQAADAATANELYRHYVQALRREGVAVETGVFQADMLVRIENDGPVTILLESPVKEKQA